MANIIALVWDFDKTLVNGYMQDPIFEEYKINSRKFWEEVNYLPKYYLEKQGVKVNPDTIYLNHFINYAKDGKFEGLNNERLSEFGKKLKFYNGIPEIFEKSKSCIKNEQKYKEFDIKVEHYIVSTGLTAVIKGSVVNQYVENIWGCEFIEAIDQNDKSRSIISEIGFTIDNTSKTRALFEINKGVWKWEHINVNSKIPTEKRRVQFENMIYIADGPSDVPAFSVIKEKGGVTFAIYPHNDIKALQQVERLRKDGRIDMYAEADYSEGTTSYLWLINKIYEIADRIYDKEKAKINSSISELPKHLV